MTYLGTPCMIPNKGSVCLSIGFKLNIQRNIDLSQYQLVELKILPDYYWKMLLASCKLFI